MTTNLVHAARGSDVHSVVVGGEIVVEAGRLVRIDELATRAAMCRTAAGLMTPEDPPEFDRL